MKKEKTQTTTQNSKSKKKISLALQGGGSHGAFTWGVLDVLLQQKDLEIEGLSGTSAGAMNTLATIQGLIRNGNEGARESLREFWTTLGEGSRTGPLQFNPMDKMMHKFDLSSNPMFMMLNMIGSIFSPYQLNPFNHNPLKELAEKFFDFKAMQECKDYKAFLCATHIATGKLRIFNNKELTIDSLLASACVPTLFQAVEVNGEFYWDGGFIGNPALYPLIYDCDATDVVVIQIRRVHSPSVPTTVKEIHNRLGEITQNSCLTREFRAISLITDLIDNGTIPAGKLKRMNMHLIRDDNFFQHIDRDSGFSADPDFLNYLFEHGRTCAKKWIAHNYEFIGKRSTADLERDFVAQE